jgi:hypothetical protein
MAEASAVSYRGRDIDLAPDLVGFPYLGFDALPDADLLLYFQDLPDRRQLRVQPLGTPPDQLRFERQTDEVSARIGADGDADNARWPANWGFPQTFAAAVQRLKDQYLGPRRAYIYGNFVRNEDATGLVRLVTGDLGQTVVTWHVPVDDSLGLTWTQPGFDDSMWEFGRTALGCEAGQPDIGVLIASRVRPQDLDPAATPVLVRIPFEVPNPAAASLLTLRVKYDDGFIAYLNGTEVARRNYPGAPTWNGLAQEHPEAAALAFENIDISAQAGRLVAGQNVLAFAVFDAAPDSPDFLLLPELVIGKIPGPGPLPPAQGEVQVEIAEVEPSPGNPAEAYVLLRNPGAQAADLSGWRLTGAGIEHVLEPGTVIGPHRQLYVVASAVAFRARLQPPTGGQGLLVQGDWEGELDVDGEELLLLNVF